MSYTCNDGATVRYGWGLGTIFGIFDRLFRGISLFFSTLIRPDANKHGSGYTRNYRPGSGPPRPPTRRIHGLNLRPSVNVPGGCSSCTGR